MPGHRKDGGALIGFWPQTATSVPTIVVFLFVPFPKIVVLNDWETISVRRKVGGGAEQLVSASSAVAETLIYGVLNGGQLEASRSCTWAA